METTKREISGLTAAIPTDLSGIAVLLIVFSGLVFGYPDAFPLARAAVGMIVVLFVPGYLLLAVLYPSRQPAVASDDPIRSAKTTTARLAHGRPPSWGERFVLSFGLIIAIVPLLGLLVTPVTGSLSPQSVFYALNVFVLVGVCVAFVRRRLLPADERLQLPSRPILDSLGTLFDRTGSRLLPVLLILTVAVALVTIGFVVLSPSNGEAYTSASLLTENAEGELVASGYPSTLQAGSDEKMTLRVVNHEGVETTYTAVAVLQRVDTSGESLSITEKERLLTTQETVAHGQTWTEPHTITPTMTGENLRVQYHVYRGEPPETLDRESSYRTLSLWVSVEPDGRL
jgi:uncharacterized membrane protein